MRHPGAGLRRLSAARGVFMGAIRRSHVTLPHPPSRSLPRDSVNCRSPHPCKYGGRTRMFMTAGRCVRCEPFPQKRAKTAALPFTLNQRTILIVLLQSKIWLKVNRVCLFSWASPSVLSQSARNMNGVSTLALIKDRRPYRSVYARINISAPFTD